MPTLSILIPVYNEEKSLAELIRRVLAVSLPDELTRELVIVNDASTDQTGFLLRQLSLEHPEIRLFEQPYNQGKGAAIRRAIQEMSGDYAIVQDADLEYDPDDYANVLAPLLSGQADVVYGSRFLNRTDKGGGVGRLHGLVNGFLTWFSNRMTGLRLTDMETCYKAFRADLLKRIRIRSNRFGIEPEITAKMARLGVRIQEVPIRYNPRNYQQGKKIGWRDGLSAILTIIKFRFIDDLP
ncbi:MAG: glycosyltransferase family 2 protein [Thermoguttaceae bacterium]